MPIITNEQMTKLNETIEESKKSTDNFIGFIALILSIGFLFSNSWFFMKCWNQVIPLLFSNPITMTYKTSIAVSFFFSILGLKLPKLTLFSFFQILEGRSQNEILLITTFTDTLAYIFAWFFICVVIF